MRFITTISALVGVVYGACEAGGDMVCEDDQVCVYRYTSDVSNAKDKDYKNLLRKDKLAAKGGEKYECFFQEDADALVANSNKKDKKTTVTFYYEQKKP